jgi:hypothetical protein
MPGDFQTTRESGGGARVLSGGLGAEPVRGGPQRRPATCGGVRLGVVQREQAKDAGRHERDDELVEPLELAAGELGSPYQLTQRASGGVADDVAVPRPPVWWLAA